MTILNKGQIESAISLMREYLAAPQNPDGRRPDGVQTERDKKRLELIESALRPLVRDYLSGKVSLADFKSQIDSINKRNEYWGFKGIKGQMFFNMVFNAADEKECDQEIKAAIAVPENEEIAASRIMTFASYVKRLGEHHLEAGGTKYGRPKAGSVPFFLSYFWQIQNPEKWPVYYTNSVNVMVDLNLWQPSGDLGADYLNYKCIHEELAKEFSKESGKQFGLYKVEHVFWFKGGNPYGDDKPLIEEKDYRPGEIVKMVEEGEGGIVRSPDSYVPPIVATLPRLARNDEAFAKAARASGTSIERTFEKAVNAAFTILGFETQLLGQGQGRVPDGSAIDIDDSYCVLWDSKVRKDHYSLGTDDRVIREYIDIQSRELKKRRALRNIYYAIISSQFADDYDDAIRSLKMETHVNEVVLVEADSLVALVDVKLRAPNQISLGPDGIQRVFSASGIVTADLIRELFI